MKRCGCCKLTRYCSVECQKSHRPEHEKYCEYIPELIKIEIDKLYGKQKVQQMQHDMKVRRKILKLVGVKPMLQCFYNGRSVDVLWDTGSMVSIVDKRWLDKNFPDQKIFSVEEFIGTGLHLRAANSTTINFEGVVLLDFSLKDGEEGVLVPVLVSSSDMEDPILGYNVIEHLILNGSQEQLNALEGSLRKQKRGFVIDPLVALVQKQAESPDCVADVKLPKAVIVPAGHRMQVKCRAKVDAGEDGQMVYFSPLVADSGGELEFSETVCTLRYGRTNHVIVDIMNHSKIDKELSKGMLLGSIHTVAAVLPMVSMVERSRDKEANVNVVNEDKNEDKVNEGQGRKGWIFLIWSSSSRSNWKRY